MQMVHKIDVVSPSGDLLCTVSAEPETSLRDLRALIEEETRIAKWAQKLFLQDEELGVAGFVGDLGSSDKPVELLVRQRDEHVASVLAEFWEEVTMLSQVPRWFHDLPEEDRGNHEIVRQVVGRNGEALRHASEKMQGTRDIVFAAVYNSGTSLQWASAKLKKDRQTVLAAVLQNGLALEFASEEMRGSREVVKAAIGNDPRAKTHAKVDIKKVDAGEKEPLVPEEPDRIIQVMGLGGHLCTVAADPASPILELKTLIEQETSIPRWEQKLLFEGKEVRRMAAFRGVDATEPVSLMLVQRSPDVAARLEELAKQPVESTVLSWLQDQAAEYKNEFDIAYEAVSRTADALEFLAPELRRNSDIVEVAVSRDGMALRYAVGAPRKDKEIVLAAVRNHGLALEFAAPELQADREVVRVAIQQDHNALDKAAPALRSDPEMLTLVHGAARGCCGGCVMS